MNDIYQRLLGELEFPMLLQGDAPKTALLEEFRLTPNAVLFATSSFWQGVDVQGEQLSCVIIDRLPFAVPTDPAVAARVKSIDAEGDRKSTRLNSSHSQISYAVFCLKKNKSIPRAFPRVGGCARYVARAALCSPGVHRDTRTAPPPPSPHRHGVATAAPARLSRPQV